MENPSIVASADGCGWVNVLVDYGGQPDIYTYSLPEGLKIQIGDILTVPFGRQMVGAIALELLRDLPPHLNNHPIRPVAGVITGGFFSSTYWCLLQHIADYYQTSLVQVVKAALPPGLLAKSQRRLRLCNPAISIAQQTPLSPPLARLHAELQQSAQADLTWQYLLRRGHSYRSIQQLIHLGWAEAYLVPPRRPQPQHRQAVTLNPGEPPPQELTPRQQEILATLKNHGGSLWLSDALHLCQTTSPTLKRLDQSGWITIAPRQKLRAENPTELTADQPQTLTPAQAQALAQINQYNQASQILLHGVTGSGKTELYLQAIAPRLAAGQSVLVLVPEIGLTPQLTDRFRRRFGQQVWVYHSGLSAGERYDTWQYSLQSDLPLVIVGTRSAIFMPLSRLGLIVLDEEHDSSYKQDVAPCYHARTVARWRAILENCPLLLGSATPCLDTWVQCQGLIPSQDRLIKGDRPLPSGYISLPERIQARPLPLVQIVDMREELQAGNHSILSRSLQTALQTMKAEGNQGLLFIHRRGHSSFVSCRSCGTVIMCPHCDVSLSYHQPHPQARMSLQCHYCGYSQAHPRHCPACHSPYLKHFGSGTQRVVNALSETLPHLSCIRFDSDTTRQKGAHRALLGQFSQGQADLLVGTQMLTKGIDLPQVTLVGIIAADGLLYRSDYWASERALQTLIQVAGRAGRGEQPGQVILQTYTPDHPVIAAVTQHSYAPFITTEWQQRQQHHYPPAAQLVLLRLSGSQPDMVERVAIAMAGHLQSTLENCSYTLLGPAPAPIPRVADRYRWQILLKFPQPATLPNFQTLNQHCPASVSLTIDVDPLNLS
ncbi:MAG: primosomal protein N' [Cyanobacteria bacterium REEB459]|nr:primosomal protein N' [Cyanobacteria bacterium REEB459]